MVRLIQFLLRRTGVCLHHLAPGGVLPDVRDIGMQVDRVFFHGDGSDGYGEICVGSAKAKRPSGLYTKSIEIAISYIDALFVVRVENIAVIRGEFVAEGIIRIGFCPCCGQLAGGSHLAGEHCRDGIADAASALTDKQDRAKTRQVSHGG